MSDARIARPSSVVLRQEQAFESRFGVAWCIGHTTPSPCGHVHSTLAAALDMPAHRTAGTALTVASWSISQPPASRKS
jgi:hypothetical protein